MWFAAPRDEASLRFSKIKQLVVLAERSGPTDRHRSQWEDFLEGYEAFERTLKEQVFENYLWHKEAALKECRDAYGDEDLSRFKSWPQYKDADEAFASKCFDSCMLDVYVDHLKIYLGNEWDIEHGLSVWVKDGVFDEMAQE